MDLFFCNSTLGAKTMIEFHFWKYEFTMETMDYFSSFANNAHVLLAISKSNNLVCIYNSINKYKLQTYQNLLIFQERSLGNNVRSFSAKITEVDDNPIEENEIYENYDEASVLCRLKHQVFFNPLILREYDWSLLKINGDFRLLHLDESKYRSPIYMVQNHVLGNKGTARTVCRHTGKRMTNISGGYKQLLFDIKTEKSFVCSCSIFDFIARQHSAVRFNYILLSYKLSQFFLHF